MATKQPMTVGDLEDLLRDLPGDTPVFFAEPMGELTALLPVVDGSMQTSHYNSEKQIHAVAPKGVTVFALQSYE